MNKVLVYKSNLLPYSETFIKEQLLSLHRWNAVLIGNSRLVNGLPLDGLQVDVRYKNGASIWNKIIGRCNLFFQRAPKREILRFRTHKAKLVHVHFATEAVRIWPVVKRLKIPMLITLHGRDINVYKEWWESGREGLAMRHYPSRLLQLSKEQNVHFIAVSEAIRDRAIEYGIPSSKISVQYIGVDCERFLASGLKITERKRRILFVGRLVEKKGAKYLLQAFKEVSMTVPEAELVIIGDGPLRGELETLADKLELNVQFKGALSSSAVQEHLHQARLFCLPSITSRDGDAEGFGLVILEAQACGVPVVTSARGGAKEGIVEGVTGFSFPEKDVKALAEKLILILKDDELTNNMSKAASRYVAEYFNIRKCTQLLEEYYDSHVEN